MAFAFNMFQDEHTKKRQRKYSDEQNDREEKMLKRKTKFLVDFALQTAEYEQLQSPIRKRSKSFNFNEFTHEEIRAAYKRSKSTYK